MVADLWKKHKLHISAKNLLDKGEPADGWGPSLSAISQGRGEFVGVYEVENEDSAYFICNVFWDEKTREPRSLEVMIDNGINNSKNSQEFFEDIEGMWHMEHLQPLIKMLHDSRISWLDPLATFRYLYK